MKKLVVLISGNGSNLQAIIDACHSGELAANIVCVISNKSNAYGLERARKNSIPTFIKEKTSNQTREQYDAELAELILTYQADLIVLAGWMRLLSNAFLQRFSHKVINLHPALPGTFPGINAIEKAFNAYQCGDIQQTGVMVHYVPDEGVDDGPVIAQKVVSINPDDTLATLAERVHQAEHELLIDVLKKI